MKHVTLTLCALLLSLTAIAQMTYDTDFTQTKVMKLSGKTTLKAGHLVFDGNDHLTMNYSDPKGEYFIVEGNLVKMNMNGTKTTLDAEKMNKVKLQRATLLNCLSGNWEQAAADNEAELIIKEENGMRNVLIQTKGKVSKSGYSSVELTYRLSDGTLTKMILDEAIGIKNIYELK